MNNLAFSPALWTTQDGKIIEYQKHIEHYRKGEIGDSWSIQISKWKLNTSISIVHEDAFGIGMDQFDGEICTTVYQVAKLPHNEFEENYFKLLQITKEKIDGKCGDI